MNQKLQAFLLQSQRSAALLMGCFCAILVFIQAGLIASVLLLTNTEQSYEISGLLWLPFLTAGLAGLEFFNAQRIQFCLDRGEGALGFSRYLSAVGEALLPSFAILMILSVTNWEIAISSPPMLGFLVILIISMLRLEVKITLLIGAIESISYLGLIMYFKACSEEVASFTALELRLLLGRTFVIAIATLIAAFIVKKMRTLLNELILSHIVQTETLQKLVTTTEEKARAEAVIWQKDQLLSILGHDLRMPLNGVAGLSELIADAPEKFTTDELKSYAHEIHGTTQKLRELLDNLLTWAQCRTGQIEITPRDYSLAAIVDPTIEIFRSTLTTKRIDLSLDFESEKHIHVDRKTTQTILRNLLSNAIKFTPPGERIRIITRKDNNKLELHIIDSGSGIPPEVLDNLEANKLSQSNFGTQQESGTGLGLLLCMDLAKQASIALKLTATADEGTQATITFPHHERFDESRV